MERDSLNDESEAIDPTPKPSGRKRWQFSLRTLFVLTTVVALVLRLVPTADYPFLLVVFVGSLVWWFAVGDFGLARLNRTHNPILHLVVDYGSRLLALLTAFVVLIALGMVVLRTLGIPMLPR